LRRLFGIPWLFAVGYLAVGFSLYFSLGIVAERGLGLTPLIFLGAGILFVLTTFTYTEGGAMYLEGGGSNTFARHAFNELVSFVAGWAVLIDYIIIVAIAAITVPHYLTPLSAEFGDTGAEIVVATAVIVGVAVVNAIGSTGAVRRRAYVAIALADFALQVAVIGVGAIMVFEPGLLTDQLDLFSSPTLSDAIYAAVIATVALAGIEAASDLTPDLEADPPDLRRVVNLGLIVVPILYAAIAAVALMAVPVVPGPNGPQTALGVGEWREAPILGVVQSFEPGLVSDAMEAAVVVVAPTVLIWAASISMLGLSRHVYTLATNRQIPSWLGKLGRRTGTPYVAIWLAAGIAIALVLPTDVNALVGLYAFGITLAVAIAHLSIVRLRVSDPDRPRPYRVPFNISFGKASLPVPALVGAAVSIAAWISVIAIHDEARWLGGGWMVFGLIAYAVYRGLVEETSLTKRVVVPARALTKEAPDAEYPSILVPVFGTPLDDDIVGTAGRLAAAAEPDEDPPRLEVVYVLELPLTVPLDAPPPPKRLEQAERALERARDVGEEYETVDVRTELIKARSAGAGIVDAASRREVDAIVLGAEPPTRIRGGSVLGGVGSSRPPEIGEVTEYVLRNAPCRVLLTAPPD
jgi:basic amino acid/polyamine antiporter, APA family